MKQIIAGLFCLITFQLYGLSSIRDSLKLPASQLELEISAGAFLMHRPTIQHIGPIRSLMYQLNYTFQSDSNQTWARKLKYPQRGMAVYYNAMEDNFYTGKIAALIAFTRFYPYRGKRISLSFRSGTGLGYIQKIYNPTDNYKNLLNSTHINGCIQLITELNFKSNKPIFGSVFAGITHFSNGAVKVPNLGINLFHAGIQIKYAGKSKKIVTVLPRKVLPFSDKKSIRILASASAKEIYPSGGNKYFSGSFQVSKFFTARKGWWTINADAFYDASLRSYLINDKISDNDNASLFLAGISGGFDFDLGKLKLPLYCGVYLYNPSHINAPVYTQLGVKYAISKHIELSVLLKTHFAKADCMLAGLGYTF